MLTLPLAVGIHSRQLEKVKVGLQKGVVNFKPACIFVLLLRPRSRLSLHIINNWVNICKPRTSKHLHVMFACYFLLLMFCFFVCFFLCFVLLILFCCYGRPMVVLSPRARARSNSSKFYCDGAYFAMAQLDKADRLLGLRVQPTMWSSTGHRYRV